MRILVAYATRYGATAGIAERVAERLAAAGLDVVARPVKDVDDVTGYDAAIIGSAVYIERWLPDAVAFVEGNATALATMPTWLFCSGPLGTETTDARGRDLREVAAPEDHRVLGELVSARDAAVFFGALDAGQLNFKDRSIRRLPVGRELLPDGDFRDWDTVESWADTIAHELQNADSPAE